MSASVGSISYNLHDQNEALGFGQAECLLCEGIRRRTLCRLMQCPCWRPCSGHCRPVDGDRNVASEVMQREKGPRKTWCRVHEIGSILTHLGDYGTDHAHSHPRYPALAGISFQDPQAGRLGGRECGREVDFSAGTKPASQPVSPQQVTLSNTRSPERTSDLTPRSCSRPDPEQSGDRLQERKQTHSHAVPGPRSQHCPYPLSSLLHLVYINKAPPLTPPSNHLGPASSQHAVRMAYRKLAWRSVSV